MSNKLQADSHAREWMRKMMGKDTVNLSSESTYGSSSGLEC